jgi:hypothetical protein
MKFITVLFVFVCQDSASSIDTENLIMSMPGNGTVQVTEHQQPQKQQPSQQLLPDPLRLGSGQVTPVLGKTLWSSPHYECFNLCSYAVDKNLNFCEVIIMLFLGCCLLFEI